MKKASLPSVRRSRRMVSISRGNAIQIAGAGLGALLLWFGAQPSRPGLQAAAMIAGYLLLYFNTHSLAHYAVGRLVGIRFKTYSVGGSAHAAAYPPIIRTIFERLPFFAAHADPVSMSSAHRTAKAGMYAAGILEHRVDLQRRGFLPYRANTPGGFGLLIFNVIWQTSSLIAEMRPAGDLGRAIRSLKDR